MKTVVTLTMINSVRRARYADHHNSKSLAGTSMSQYFHFISRESSTPVSARSTSDTERMT